MTYDPAAQHRARALDGLRAAFSLASKEIIDARHHKPGDVHRQTTGPLAQYRAAQEGLVVRLLADAAHTDESVRKGPLAQPFYFQCPPLETFEPVYGFAHSEVYTVGPGQVSRKNGRTLRTISFDTLFVDFGTYQVSPYLLPGMDPANAMRAMMRRLESIAESGSALRLQAYHRQALYTVKPTDRIQPQQLSLGAQHELMDIDGTTPGWLVTLRTVKVSEKHGEGDTRYVTAEFHEYVDPLQTALEAGHREHHRPSNKGPWHHHLGKHDSLNSLCQHFYHSTGTHEITLLKNSLAKKYPKIRALKPKQSIVDAHIPHLGLNANITIPAKPPAHKHGRPRRPKRR